MREEQSAVHVADLRRCVRRRCAGAVEQHAAAVVLRTPGLQVPGQAGRLRVPAVRQRHPVPDDHGRVRAGRPVLPGVPRATGRARRLHAGGVRVPGRRCPGRPRQRRRWPGRCRVHGRRRPGQLEVRGHTGRFRAVHRVPGAHAARLRHAVQPAQRARLLRHVLRGLSAHVVRLPAGHPVDDGHHRLRPVQTVRCVY